MKALKFLTIVLLAPVVFLACSKDDAPSNPPAAKVEGVWVGKYGFGSETPNVFFSLNIKPGGVIEELNKSGQSKGSGNWTLNGNTLKAKYKWTILSQGSYSIQATLNLASGKLSGTWGYDDNPADGGLFEMSK